MVPQVTPDNFSLDLDWQTLKLMQIVFQFFNAID
jgi:uncharacterized protein YktA (UPF0223 family)